MGVETDGLRVAAWVVARVHAEVEFSHQGMEAAMTYLCSYETLAAIFAVEITKSGIKFEKDLLPWEVLLLSQEHNKLVDIP